MTSLDASPSSVSDFNRLNNNMLNKITPKNLETELTQTDEIEFNKLFNVVNNKDDDYNGTLYFNKIALLRKEDENERFPKPKHDKTFNNEDYEHLKFKNELLYFNQLSLVYNDYIARDDKVMNELYETQPLELYNIVLRSNENNFNTDKDDKNDKNEGVSWSVISPKLDWSETYNDEEQEIIHEDEYKLRADKLAKRLISYKINQIKSMLIRRRKFANDDEFENFEKQQKENILKLEKEQNLISLQIRSFQLNNYIAARTRIAAESDFETDTHVFSCAIFQASTNKYKEELVGINNTLVPDNTINVNVNDNETDNDFICEKRNKLLSNITNDDINILESHINHFKSFINSMDINQQKLNDLITKEEKKEEGDETVGSLIKTRKSLSSIDYNKLLIQDSLTTVISNIASQVDEIIITKLQNQKVLKSANRNRFEWKIISNNNNSSSSSNNNNNEFSLEAITKRALINFKSIMSSSNIKITLVLDISKTIPIASLFIDKEEFNLKFIIPKFLSDGFANSNQRVTLDLM